jgi:diguanylate cyclase (GGDEF)-like protein
LLISAAQLAYSYRHVQLEFEDAVREIGETHVPLLSVSIWDIEPDAVRQQLERIAARREIGYVVLSVATGQVFEAGDRELAGRYQARAFVIPQPGRPSVTVGKLEVYANPGAFYREVVFSVGAIVIGYGVLTLLICILVVVLLKRELERPLHAIAEFVATLTPDRLTAPLKLDRPKRLERDEIDLVVDGFQVLQDGIQSHISNLDHMVAQRTQELEAALASIRELSLLDPLTGCFNRRSFGERISREIERAIRYRRSLSVVFSDIDFFKVINDTYGHQVGDQVLQAFATCLRDGLRADIDWVARYGGEEFVIVLPETDERSAVAGAERLRRAIEASVPVPDHPTLRLTASFGVAQLVPDDTADTLVNRADNLLYAAKEAGRNRTLPLLDSKLESQTGAGSE